jgi:hypothetical protein
MNRKNTVVYLHQLDPQAALERLNRLTGLQFSGWPQSLAPQPQELAQVTEALTGERAAVAEPLSYVAEDVRKCP